MRNLPRLLTFLALLAVVLYLLGEVHQAQAVESADQSRIVVLFAGILVAAVLAGIVAAWTFLPAIGDKIGELIYGSAEINDDDPLLRGHEKLELGDHPGALKWFQKALEKDPDDTAAMSEIVDVQCRHLAEPGEALALIEEALQRQWPLDEVAFLRCKQAEIYGRYLGDLPKAREILQRTIEDAPQTLYARGAQTLLLEFADPEES